MDATPRTVRRDWIVIDPKFMCVNCITRAKLCTCRYSVCSPLHRTPQQPLQSVVARD